MENGNLGKMGGMGDFKIGARAIEYIKYPNYLAKKEESAICD